MQHRGDLIKHTEMIDPKIYGLGEKKKERERKSRDSEKIQHLEHIPAINQRKYCRSYENK